MVEDRIGRNKRNILKKSTIQKRVTKLQQFNIEPYHNLKTGGALVTIGCTWKLRGLNRRKGWMRRCVEVLGLKCEKMNKAA